MVHRIQSIHVLAAFDSGKPACLTVSKRRAEEFTAKPGDWGPTFLKC